MIGCEDVNTMFLRDQKYEQKASFRVLIVASSQHEGTGWLAREDLPKKNRIGV